MSALNFVTFRDKIAVIADTAAYYDDGMIGRFTSKIGLCTKFPGVVATCGNFLIGRNAKDVLCDVESFDALIDDMREFIADAPESKMTYAICGFSDVRGALEVWLANTIDGIPFSLRSEAHIGQPVLSSEDLVRGFGKAIRDPNQITNLQDFARTLITLQRECKWGAKEGFAEGVHLVGGVGELAIVTRDRAEVRTVIEWPDEIGELIMPAPVDWSEWRRTHAEQADPPSQNGPRMSRRERRAAESNQRKARRAA